jgi:hypothetical protein
MNTGSILKLSVHHPQKAIEFLISKLGFMVLQNDHAFGESGEIVVKDRLGNNYLVTDNITDAVTNDDKGNIPNVILTNDCLKDYFMLSAAGVIFKGAPKYADDALTIEITDRCGNRYLLTEQRNCDED